MSVEIETTHILDNLFCLKPNNELHAFLMKHAKLGVSITAYWTLGNELRLSSEGLAHAMSDHETSLMEKLDAYEKFCIDNKIEMDE